MMLLLNSSIIIICALANSNNNDKMHLCRPRLLLLLRLGRARWLRFRLARDHTEHSWPEVVMA